MLLVFNCGGTNTRMGVSRDGEAISKVCSFATRQNFDEQLIQMKVEANNLLDGQKLDGAAGGIAGVWETNKTKLYRSPNLPEWEGVTIEKKFKELFGVRVILGNDAEMEGLGEAMVGAGRRKRIVGYLTIGTGIGGVKIEDGKICSRIYGFEPGHQIIDVNEEVGYLDDFASGSAMRKIYGKPPEEIDDMDIWEKETQMIAVAIHNAVCFWSPEIVIMGGSLMQKIKMSNLRQIIGQQMKRLPKLPEIVQVELKEKAGLYGALAALRSNGLN